MISDVLSDALTWIDEYLEAGDYDERFIREIKIIRDAMKRVQQILDAQMPVPYPGEPKPISLRTANRPLVKVLAVAVLRDDEAAIPQLLDLLNEMR